jgi:hypothetical protein
MMATPSTSSSSSSSNPIIQFMSKRKLMNALSWFNGQATMIGMLRCKIGAQIITDIIAESKKSKKNIYGQARALFSSQKFYKIF